MRFSGTGATRKTLARKKRQDTTLAFVTVLRRSAILSDTKKIEDVSKYARNRKTVYRLIAHGSDIARVVGVRPHAFERGTIASTT